MTGKPLRSGRNRATPFDRAMALIEKQPNGCWLWIGKRKTREGYGWIKVSREDGTGRYMNRRAHRVIYEGFNGYLSFRLVLAHTCDNPSCCNPEHLRAVEQAENVRDMIEKGRAWWQRARRQADDEAPF